jgi:hypothetical protein
MVVFLLPSLILSILLSVVLTVLLNFALIPALLIGGLLFLLVSTLFGGLLRV